MNCIINQCLKRFLRTRINWEGFYINMFKHSCFFEPKGTLQRATVNISLITFIPGNYLLSHSKSFFHRTLKFQPVSSKSYICSSLSLFHLWFLRVVNSSTAPVVTCTFSSYTSCICIPCHFCHITSNKFSLVFKFSVKT